MNNIPRDEDWGSLQGNRDLQYAYKVFHGKSIEEAEELFELNVLARCEDLGCMPILPFQFYILSYRNHIASGNFRKFQMSSAANGFMELVADKMRTQPNYVLPMMKELMPTLELIAYNQLSFKADIDIYGDFKLLLNEILRLSNI
ncbi:hypothetical protein ACVW0Y_001215 [Pseudomonas sp. TE3786]